MMMKRAISIFQVFVFILCVNFLALGQAVCNGDKIFTEKSCAGDEISDAEIKLYQIINQYRKENNLPPVPISKALSVLANRHLLDIVNNLKKTTHAWSNCPYDLNDRKTWDCVSEAPKRLNVGYEGQAFENLYRNFDGNADPVAALGAWKKSDLHNSLILNLSIWKDKNFDAIGVGFNGQYAAIWFGTSNSQVTKSIRPQGLGISYKDILKNLGNVVAMQKFQASRNNAPGWECRKIKVFRLN